MAHGRYTIIGKLADGGMAEIFLATQHGAEGFQKPVVLKRVLTAFSADPQFRNMFLDEAHISMSLSHGNIVQVLDVGVAGERTFLVLELVEGWDLEQLMERAQATGPEHPWPPSLALYVTAQICRGLSYAHAKRGADGRPLGIVHRDVSPNNVLISEQGEVKLADFGIAKAESKREQTLAGVIKGKIGFMSPEQALGRPLDARADLFSVGTVMYLMLTGRRPFHADSELESMMLAQRAEYRPPEDLNPYLSSEATAIVGRAMQREPGARYQTADQMLVDVERVLRSQYHSAGQTELKLWLADLARRDGVPPIGRARLDESAPVFVDESGDLSAGSSLELSDVDRTAAAVAAATTAVAIPVSTPAVGSAVTVDKPVTAGRGPTSDTDRSGASDSAGPTPSSPSSPPPPLSHPLPLPLPTGRLPRRSRVGLGFVLGAVCMLGAVFGIRWLAQWAGRERLGLPGWYQSEPDASSSGTLAVTGSSSGPASAAALHPTLDARELSAGQVPSADAASLGAVAPLLAPGAALDSASRASLPDGAIVAAPRSGQPAKASIPSTSPPSEIPEDDEARLLGRLVPDAAAVIGEDEAEEVPPTRAAKGKTATSAKSGAGSGGIANPVETSKAARRSPRLAGDAEKAATTGRLLQVTSPIRPPPPVQIRITTSPLGAVVRTKKQVLGRTPLAVRFNPGSTYELTFVKSGYVTNSRRVSVSAGKPKSISVAMKKAPPPVRHGLFRGR